MDQVSTRADAPGRARRRGAIALAALVVTALSGGLAGCGGDGGDDAKGPATHDVPSSAATAIDSTPGTGKKKASARTPHRSRRSPADPPLAPQVSEGEGAAADVMVLDCDPYGAKPRAAGKVTNSTGKAADYVIAISWINKHFDVRGRAVTVVADLAPGRSRSWKVTGPADVDGAVSCAQHVVRGAVHE